jgi:hypothetical protein
MWGSQLCAAVEVEVEVEVVGGEVDILEVVELEVEEGEKNGFVKEESSYAVKEKPN